MREIIETEIAGEKVSLKKDIFNQWTVVYPLKNKDGTINWFNLITGGSKFGLLITVIAVVVLLLAANEYHSNLAYCTEVLKNIVKG